ncbi:MAG TPA: DcaP family trimeric outer membrane transporter, partial [Vicinamibacterales bacterium]|nr:DcaP family trimeric outer membrane transporter [Vicinamibacterales bacterium]
MKWATTLFMGALLTLGVPSPAAARQGEAAAPQSTDDLRRRIDDLERLTKGQIDALRAQLAVQEAELARLRAAASAPPPAAPTAAPASDRAVVSASATQETFSRDRETAARVDNIPIDPAMTGFFGIPNTPARLKVDGYAKLDAIFDPHPAGNSDQFNVGSIPIGLTDAERVANTNIHVRQTRVQLDFRSPSALGSDLRAFAETDFFGSSGAVDPRMRHFYGQLQNVLLGQTWTTFTDVDAFPDQLDFSGPAGMTVLRQPQIRYTQPLATGQSLAFAIEKATVQAPQITSSGSSYTPAPDIVVRYRLDRPLGHVQVGSLSRVLGYRIDSR